MPNTGRDEPQSKQKGNFNLYEMYRKTMNVTPKYITMKYIAINSSKVILVVDRLLNCTKYHYDCNDYLTFIEGVVGERDFERMAMFFEEGK